MFDVLAIDWGSKRCGLAFGSTQTQLVLPYDQECQTSDSLKILNEQISRKSIQKIILGRPTNFSGGDTQTGVLIDQYADILRICFPQIELISWNERGTTKDAVVKLDQPKKPNSKQTSTIKAVNKSNINHLAAAQILEDYLRYSKL
jgi:putative holliday junction resolvase